MPTTHRYCRSLTVTELLKPTGKPPILDNFQASSIRSLRQATDQIEELLEENSRLNKIIGWSVPLAFFAGVAVVSVAWRIFQ